MRLAASLAAALLLAGCGAEPAGEPQAEAPFGPYVSGPVAVSDDYRIQATFPDDQPVCVSASGTQVQGFHQWTTGDCADESQPSGRFISVWADYNVALASWDEALGAACGADTDPFDLGMAATGDGRLAACIPKLCGDQFVITALYLSGTGGGPELIYRLALGTTAATQEADLARFRAFLSQLRLDGAGFAPAA